jgi:glycosyltransferase involved in cell wall biosynthesis
MRRSIRSLTKRVPGAAVAMRRLDRSRHLRWIERSGLFDLDWYRHQTADVLPDELTALNHYLDRGRRNGLTPSPLFDPRWFDPQHWRSTTVDPLVRYLLNGPGRHGPHPVFDDRAWARAHTDAAGHPGRALGHFLSVRTDSTPVPIRGGAAPMTWAQLLAVLTAATDAWSADAYVGRRRVRRRPDLKAEQAFRRRWAGWPAPAAGDGPLVSVITPVRNRPTQVLAAIASVQAQTLGSWELLVVDDGSTDATAEAVRIVAAADRRVRLVSTPPSGVSAARNTGIRLSRGRYVAFLDSDNVWTPEFLQQVTTAMDGSGARAGYAALEIVEGPHRRYLAFQGDLHDLAYGNHVDLNILLVERSLLEQVGGFDPALRRMVDYDLIVRLARTTELLFCPVIGAVYDASQDVGTRISTTESLRWDEAVKNRLFLDWPALHAAAAHRVPGRVSVLLASAAPPAITVRAVEHLLRQVGEDDDVEVVVLDNGSPRAPWLSLSALLFGRPAVRLLRSPRNVGPVLGANQAFAFSTGQYVVVARPEVVVDGPWLAPLRAALADPAIGAAQPLVLDGRGLVASAGAAPLRADRYGTVLAGFPAEDAQPLLGTDLPAAIGPLVALRAVDVAAGGGLDPLLGPDAALADLVWRTSEPGRPRPARLVDVPPVRDLPARPAGSDADSTAGARLAAGQVLLAEWALDAFPADEHEQRVFDGRPLPPPAPGVLPDPWARAGLALRPAEAAEAALLSGGTDPGDEPAEPVPAVAIGRIADRSANHSAAGSELPALRWSIVTAAPAGPAGDSWGDVHFASSLARALRELGQQVVVERREAAGRPSGGLDDAVLVLRGLDQVEPRPGAANLIWVISHPDQVEPAELAGFDRAFAASTTWSARLTGAGIRVDPLLQATDPEVFAPDRAAPGTGPAVLFVGNSRNVLRPVVRDAIEAGLPLVVYGSRWEKLIDPARVAGQFVPNDELGALYRSAGVVLNDHWDDMAREGFLSNRLFDAVASGARVITDDVPGLRDVFGPEVQVATGVADLRRLAGGLGAETTKPGPPFPDEAGLQAAAARVHAEHTFAVRARQLLAAVLEVRGEQSADEDDHANAAAGLAGLDSRSSTR